MQFKLVQEIGKSNVKRFHSDYYRISFNSFVPLGQPKSLNYAIHLEPWAMFDTGKKCSHY